MKSFKHYIIEVVSWEKNTLFAIGPRNGPIEYVHDTKSRMIEHPDAFKHLNFNERPHSGEHLMGIEDLSHESAREYPGTDRPKASSWGRIDHENKVVHIVTQHGLAPYGLVSSERNKKIREDDVFHRLHAIKQIKQTYPDYSIQHGYEGGWASPRVPRVISSSQYEKELMDHLNEHS